MIILIHVLIALSSLILASVALFRPSLKKLSISYGLIIATVASGSLLLITSPSHILKTCLEGLLYLTVVSIITIATHVRLRNLANEHVSNEDES